MACDQNRPHARSCQGPGGWSSWSVSAMVVHKTYRLRDHRAHLEATLLLGALGLGPTIGADSLRGAAS